MFRKRTKTKGVNGWKGRRAFTVSKSSKGWAEEKKSPAVTKLRSEGGIPDRKPPNTGEIMSEMAHNK